MITMADIYHDLVITVPFFLWVLFVVKYFSRWIYDLAVKKGYPPDSATYFGRKAIHIFASGLIALSLPFLFKEPFLPFLSALILAIYTYLPHRKGQLYRWFQIKDNFKEVNFCLMWGLVILFGWFFDRTFWLGVIPALFLSFGDGVTGIVRNIKYKKRTKAWEGSLAMLICCSLIGIKMGFAGILAAVFATIVERVVPIDSNIIDDNILIPLVSFLVLLFFQTCIP